MKKQLYLIISLFCITSWLPQAKAQSVSINSSGSAPNASAMLDIGSGSGGTLGLLIPRMLSAQRTGITTLPAAAQGLIVYQTDGLQGFYYNTSTTTTPSWHYLTPDGWSLTGNAGTTAGTNFIGTTDAIDLVIKTNNAERMRVTSAGFVGINTTPTTLFDIDGGASSTTQTIATITGNSLTTGIGLSVTSSSITTGNLIDVRATNASGSNSYSIYGENNSPTGDGIVGNEKSTTGVNRGVFGESSSNDGYGVVGYNSSTTAPTTTPQAAGVYGQTDAPGAIGVWGIANNATSTQSYAIWGQTSAGGTNSVGVVGAGNGISASPPAAGAGGYFIGNTYALYATSSGGSATYGLYVINTGSNGNGLRAECSNGSGAYAIWGVSTTGYAGYFSGNVYVSGNFSVGGTKSFLIDDPLDPMNKTLRHNCVESPENLCLYRGKVKLDSHGKGIVKMPGYFKALTKENEATVTLTAIGEHPFLTSYKWNEDYSGFTVYGDSDKEVSYEVLAARDDPAMHQHSKPVVEEKGNGNFRKGTLLDPKAYGYPQTMGWDYYREHLKTNTVTKP